MSYSTSLVIGRAFALANDPATASNDPGIAAELCRLAGGDRLTVMVAHDRYRALVTDPTPAAEERRALRLLEAAADWCAELDGPISTTDGGR